MKTFFGIFALIGLASCSVQNWTEIRVKYSWTSSGVDSDAFFSIPSTLEGALAGDWVATNVTNYLNLQAVSYDGDCAFTPLYDSNGILAGGQIATPVDVINSTRPPTFDPLAPGTNEIITIDGKQYYSSTFLFTDPATLKSGGRSSLTEGVVGDGLWFRNTSESNGFTQIPDDLDDLLSETLFTWQNCLPSMGIHYFYNASSTADCNQFYSWFLLGKEGSVTGLGYQLFGESSKLVQKRNWYDNINRLATKLTVPITNDCLYDWAQSYGVISMHVYFTPSPWAITCDQKTESASPITLFNLPGTVASTVWQSIFG